MNRIELALGNYWCPIKLSSPIDFLFSSDSRHIECVGASLEDKNPLDELELGKYGILVNQYPTKGELFIGQPTQSMK